MSLAKRLLNNPGLIALTVDGEREEVMAVLKRPMGHVTLQYLRGSKQKGLRLWNVLSPQLAGYVYTKDTGFPTFSLSTLQAKGLV